MRNKNMLLIISILVAVAAILTTIVKKKLSYWSRKNLPFIEPSFPFGNFQNVFKKTKNIGNQVKEMYDVFKKKGDQHGGIYFALSPTYLPINLEYIKTIMTKDFMNFNEKASYVNEKDDPLSAHLLNIGGLRWKNLRTKLSPTFTSGKMRMMFKTLEECAKLFEEKIRNTKAEGIDMKKELSHFAIDVIGSCAFGLDCNAINDDNSVFRTHGTAILNLRGISVPFKQLIVALSGNLARALGISITPKDTIHFFLDFVKESIEYREKNNIVRKDFLQILINAKNNKDDIDHHDGSSLTIEEITAQCFVFFIAGSGTSSSTMDFALYEMSVNQDIQNKVREEINKVLTKCNNELSYDALAELKYMDQVISETLRKYPPIPVVTRICVNDYKMPGTDLVIEKGTQCMLSILGLHYDEEYYPQPMKFDPERFSEENKRSRPQYAYIPFGEGPRICIGARFGMMQVKTGLIYLLKNWRFTVNSKTQEPLKMAPRAFVTAPVGGIWLDRHEL